MDTSGDGGVCVLIDTHCHVHVDVSSQPQRQQQQATSGNCCLSSPPMSAEDATQKIAREDTNTGRHHGPSPRPRSPLYKDPESDTRSGRADGIGSVCVLHIPMGIQENDWARAIQFSCKTVGLETGATTGGGSDTEEQKQQLPQQPVAALLEDASFRFGIGLHPWSAHSGSESWLRDLTALLEKHPQALVGEIGLDKVARTPDTRRVEWSDQVNVFSTQMALAARLSRPVSVHCVKAHGKLADILGGRNVGNEKDTSNEMKKQGKARADAGYGRDCAGPPEVQAANRGGTAVDRCLPPRIALHSFTGSVEVAQDICRNTTEGSEVFFGFSAAVNMRGDRERKGLLGVLRVIPESSILIETDRNTPTGAGEELMRVCRAVAEAKGFSIEEAIALANRNARRFLSPLGKLPRLPFLG